MKPAARTILLGQAVFYAGLAVCVLLKPAGLAANDGISYYGIYRETVLPYAIGLLGAAYFAVRTIDRLPPDETVLQTALKVYAVLVAGLVVTPYAAGKWVDYLHTACGSALFSLQLVLSCWLVWRLHYVWWSAVCTLIELSAGIASALYLAPTHGLLLQTQFIFQAAFGVLLIMSLQRLPKAEADLKA